MTTSFQDSQPAGTETEDNQTSSLSNVPPPDFLILRAGKQSPERFISGTDEEARETAQRQVRQSNGSTKRVFVYKLMFCEQHESSSKTLNVDEIKEMYKPKTTATPSDAGE